MFKKGGVVSLAQRGQVLRRSGPVLSPHFFETVHAFPDESAVQAVKNALEILGDDATNDGATWVPMEINGQLDPSLNLDVGLNEPEHYKYSFYLLPIVIVLILVVVQHYM